MNVESPYFVLNVNPDAPDVVHRNPGESCNTQADEMSGRQVIDPDTAEALLKSKQAVPCGHCYQEGLP